ncbi:hypothetical protein [Mucilaginibacter sp.]|uniref:hypothetical protein n=1 Tax=Mucilaginibacter sp. TaxID=1882438 RepID=UPI002625B194|nr:hypothetical protein [Mucilaginibacter sp.]MDB4923495.1 hypothetical protein [Mucilaginibacter sp.]
MKQKEVFKKIGGIIQELNEQYEYLETVSDNLNDLELELFVANAHFLTDHIEILCKLNLQNRPKRLVIEKPETYQQKFFEPVVQQMKPGADLKELRPLRATTKPVEAEITSKQPEPEIQEEKSAKKEEKQIKEEKQPEEHTVPQFDFTSQTTEDTYSFIREEPETIRHELILDESETWEDEENGEVAVEEKKENEPEEGKAPALTEEAVISPGAEKVKETAIEEIKTDEVQPDAGKTEEEPISKEAVKGEVEETEVITRNQKMSSQAASKSDQLNIKPISDIKLAITLNDKLLYVKDLFNGYNLAYSEAIEILNRFNTFEEAQRFLKTNYVTKNNWEGKQATADKFYALLKRRYA